ncbi:MAG TPA: type II toxin-antitoxin system RelE/ParE family toxin [Thermoplasmata archaeon]|nr:type II toxin-antitoxin system RelE/ParE family toxin [Thermoplasmata archaeon]
MRYTVLLHPKALRVLRSLHPEDRARVQKALEGLEADPFRSRSGADIKKLQGTKGRRDLYRIRMGRFRAVYGIVGKEVRVTDLFERGQGYEV